MAKDLYDVAREVCHQHGMAWYALPADALSKPKPE
jgi:hypothetical protein